MTSPLIIAHRGESFDAPENTMTAINLAWERGTDALEIDVQLSKDNVVVVIHDTDTKRLAGVKKKVREQTLEELKLLDVGIWKGARFKGEKIPILTEVLASVPLDKKLIIEIKGGSEAVPFVADLLNESSLNSAQVEIIGFDIHTMTKVREVFPDNKVLWLLDLDYYWYTKIFKPSIKKAITKANQFEFDGLNVWAGNILNESMVRQVHDAGLLLYCWTVDDMEHATKLMDWGIDAITTNRAAWMKETFSE